MTSAPGGYLADRPSKNLPVTKVWNAILRYAFTHSSSGSPQVFADTINLSGSQYSSYTNLFDQFRITRVSIRVKPDLNVTTLSETGDSSAYITAIDVTENGTRTYQQLQVNPSAVETPITEPHFHQFTPMWVINNICGTGWLSSAAYATNFYGLKTAMPGMGSSVTWTYFVTMEVSFRGCY